VTAGIQHLHSSEKLPKFQIREQKHDTSLLKSFIMVISMDPRIESGTYDIIIDGEHDRENPDSRSIMVQNLFQNVALDLVEYLWSQTAGRASVIGLQVDLLDHSILNQHGVSLRPHSSQGS